MKSIEIFIWDGNKIKQNELLGKDTYDCTNMYLSNLFFSETSIDGYYIQNHIDSETKTKNIIIVIGGSTFCSPYTEEKEKLLKSCLI